MKSKWAGLVMVAWAAGVLPVAGAETPVEAQAALQAARARLAELRQTCKEGHPLVQAQLRRIAELEQEQRFGSGPAAELAAARSRLAELRQTCKEGHPLVQAQLKRIAELERQVEPRRSQE